MTDLINIGLNGLMAFQQAIAITAENMSNVDTPFYSRRSIQFVNNYSMSSVSIGDIPRIYDESTNVNLLNMDSAKGSSSFLYQQMTDFEKLLDNDQANVSFFLQASLKGIQDLTGSVSSVQSRGAYLATLANVSNEFQSLNTNIESRKASLITDMSTTVTTANTIIQQISTISTQIAQTSQNTNTDTYDALLDQRNQLVHQLAGYVNLSTHVDDNNNLTLSLSNGATIMSEGVTNFLSLLPNNADPSRMDIYLGAGSSLQDVTSLVTSGQLGSMLNYRNTVLDTASAGLNKLALALTQAFNKQNNLGADLNGNLGQNIFNDVNTITMQQNRVIPNLMNTGTGVSMAVNVNDATQITTSDYTLSFSDPTHYTLTRNSDNTTMASGAIGSYPATITADGFTLSIAAGAFAAGDSFIVRPTAGGMDNSTVQIIDGSLLALAFPVSAARNITNTGTGTIEVSSITDTTNGAFSVPQQLTPPVTVQFLSPTSYQLVNTTTNAVMEGPIAYDPSTTNNLFPTPGSYDPGYRVTLTGAVQTGDSFNIQYNTAVSGANDNAELFRDLYTNKLLDNGKSTLSENYMGVSLNVSAQTNAATINYDTTKILHEQARESFYQVSGVSDIEELTNLTNYQEALQASAQIIQVAKTIFDTIISLAR